MHEKLCERQTDGVITELEFFYFKIDIVHIYGFQIYESKAIDVY